MTIYTGNDYRKIYESHHGTIPRDADGRSYHIHHIDGDRENNVIENLQCVSIQEHYDIHYSQGDWGACHRLAVILKLSPAEISFHARETNLERILTGSHHLLGKNNHRYNHTIYSFIHESGIAETCTYSELQQRYTVNQGNLWSVIHGFKRSANGWSLVGAELLSYWWTDGVDCVRAKTLPAQGWQRVRGAELRKKLGKKMRTEKIPQPAISRIDQTIHSFVNDSGLFESCTRYALMKKYNLNGGNVYRVVKGDKKSVKGWRLV
jgi:hypothetical protein